MARKSDRPEYSREEFEKMFGGIEGVEEFVDIAYGDGWRAYMLGGPNLTSRLLIKIPGSQVKLLGRTLKDDENQDDAIKAARDFYNNLCAYAVFGGDVRRLLDEMQEKHSCVRETPATSSE